MTWLEIYALVKKYTNIAHPHLPPVVPTLGTGWCTFLAKQVLPLFVKSVHCCTLSHYPNAFFVSVGPRTHAACCCLELVLIWFWCGISSTYGRERESGSDLYYLPPPSPHPSWEGSLVQFSANPPPLDSWLVGVQCKLM
jgi:hypothetical protein